VNEEPTVASRTANTEQRVREDGERHCAADGANQRVLDDAEGDPHHSHQLTGDEEAIAQSCAEQAATHVGWLGASDSPVSGAG
jgi:hypothetical protein